MPFSPGPASAASGPAYPPNVYNADPALLPRWRTAVSKARQGDARARLAVAGDSTSAGANAGTGTGGTSPKGAIRRGPSRLAARLAAGGLPVNTGGTSFGSYGAADSLANAPAFDPLLTAVSGFSPSSYGFANAWGASSAGSMTWTLPACTNIDLYTMLTGNAGTMSYSIDGGAAQTYTFPTSGGVGVINITGLTLGQHTIKIDWVSGFNFVIGPNSYNAAVPAIDVFNGGFSGSTTNGWASSSAFEKGPSLKVFNPDLTLIYLTTNDQNQGVAVSDAMNNLTTIAGYARFGGGDIVLVIPHPINGPTAALQSSYQQAFINLGTTLNCPVLDLYGRGKTWASANTAGRMTDNLHPNAAGYDDLWSWIGSQLLAMI